MTNTFRTASHASLLEASDLTEFHTREGWPQGCGPPLSKKSWDVSPPFRQHLHGVPRYRSGRIHHCHFAVSVHKINLAATSWSRGEFQGGSRGLCVRSCGRCSATCDGFSLLLASSLPKLCADNDKCPDTNVGASSRWRTTAPPLRRHHNRRKSESPRRIPLTSHGTHLLKFCRLAQTIGSVGSFAVPPSRK